MEGKPCHNECYIPKNFEKCAFCDDYLMENYHYRYRGDRGKMVHILCYNEMMEDGEMLEMFELEMRGRSVTNFG